MAGSIYVCGTCGGALGRPERHGDFRHRTTPNCGREPTPMLRHVLEERLRLGEDVSGHGRPGNDDWHRHDDRTGSAEISTDASSGRPPPD